MAAPAKDYTAFVDNTKRQRLDNTPSSRSLVFLYSTTDVCGGVGLRPKNLACASSSDERRAGIAHSGTPSRLLQEMRNSLPDWSTARDL
eukprot:5843160-Amphidinium_carterae.1